MIRHLKRTIALLLMAALFLAAAPVTYAAEDAVEPVSYTHLRAHET